MGYLPRVLIVLHQMFLFLSILLQQVASCLQDRQTRPRTCRPLLCFLHPLEPFLLMFLDRPRSLPGRATERGLNSGCYSATCCPRGVVVYHEALSMPRPGFKSRRGRLNGVLDAIFALANHSSTMSNRP